jgi:glucose-6-phosphate 1-dehydrogenase
MLLRPVEMRFAYKDAFAIPSLDAYETLVWDLMNVDATLFMRADQIEAAWLVLMPVLEAWQRQHRPIFPTMPRALGDPRQPTNCSRAGRAWRPMK